MGLRQVMSLKRTIEIEELMETIDGSKIYSDISRGAPTGRNLAWTTGNHASQQKALSSNFRSGKKEIASYDGLLNLSRVVWRDAFENFASDPFPYPWRGEVIRLR